MSSRKRIEPDRLYIGVNYHPHDWPEERWELDIAKMREAGFDTIRLGHLCWDSFEPDDGHYEFGWFDKMMDLCAEAGLGVVLDLSMRPAPVWVHRLCPGCTIGAKSGRPVPAVRRYMEDVADPDYQHYALRFARDLASRYKDHPALLAFGLCNELGAGYPSYSETSLQRFRIWLKKKYGNIDALNCAWATQRWSRRLQSFDDVVFPENEVERGAPEAWLDMRRFFSDGIAAFLIRLKETVEDAAPGIPHSSNHYSGKNDLGFDYLRYADSFVNYPGIGHYPGYEMNDKAHYALMILKERLAEQEKPLWCLEFQSGANGIYAGPRGWLTMQAMLCLMNRTQMILGWTWRTMLNGEEEFFGGLLGHDGYPTPNYEEYANMAAAFRKLEKAGFPRRCADSPVALAFSQESQWETQAHPVQFRQGYTQAVLQAHMALFTLNLDYNMVNLRDLRRSYRLLLVPAHVIMERASAESIRRFVSEGGCIIMTGYSAVTDETGRAFDSPCPGLLSDVFGLRVAGFSRAGIPDFYGEIVPEAREICFEDGTVTASLAYTEQLELHSAEAMATFVDGSCAVSVHPYGKGKAYYVAAEANNQVLLALILRLAGELNLPVPQDIPDGVQCRELVPGKRFFVNTTNRPVAISLNKPCHGLLTEQDYTDSIEIPPFTAELLTETGE